MKTIRFLLSAALILAAGLAVAQTSPEPAATPAKVPAKPPLNENVTLSFEGMLDAANPFKFTWTGVGPTMNLLLPLTNVDTPTMQACQGMLTQVGDSYHFEGTVAARIPQEKITSPTDKSYIFTAARAKISVDLKPGETVTAVDANGQLVKMTLTKPADSLSINPATPLDLHAIPPNLNENIVLTANAGTFGSTALNISATVASPSFLVATLSPMVPGSSNSLQSQRFSGAKLVEVAGGFYLEYSVIQMMPQVSAYRGQTKMIANTIAEVVSTVLLKPGQPVVVCSIGGQSVSIVAEPAK